MVKIFRMALNFEAEWGKEIGWGGAHIQNIPDNLVLACMVGTKVFVLLLCYHLYIFICLYVWGAKQCYIFHKVLIKLTHTHLHCVRAEALHSHCLGLNPATITYCPCISELDFLTFLCSRIYEMGVIVITYL